MRLSSTLSFYIGRQFLVSFAALLCLFLMLVLLMDVIELMRRAASKGDISMALILEMAFMKLPYMGQQIFPFAALFGGMSAFWRLTRNHELQVTRAAGISAWQFLMPVLVLAFSLGVISITLLNPLASTTLTRFERLEAVLLKGQKSFLAISDAGLWLRQSNRDGQSVVHAESILQHGTDVELTEVIVFVYQGKDKFRERINAATARLEDGFWRMTDVSIYHPEQVPEIKSEHMLETDLTLDRIQDSFAPPETMSFWNLPEFINTLEKAGFSALRHRLQWHSLLALPLLMCAMILIAATFTLRRTQRGGAGHVIGAGIMTGFLLYFITDLVFAFGLSESIPVTLAAWTPSGVALLLGLALLLHLEDG